MQQRAGGAAGRQAARPRAARSKSKKRAAAARDLDVPLALRPHPAAEHQAARLSARSSSSAIATSRRARPARCSASCGRRRRRSRRATCLGSSAAGRRRRCGRSERRVDRAVGPRAPGGRRLSPLSGQSQDARRRRLRRPAAAHRRAVRRNFPPVRKAEAAAVRSCADRRISGHEPQPVPDRERRSPTAIATCASWATTINRSTAGAAPK